MKLLYLVVALASLPACAVHQQVGSRTVTSAAQALDGVTIRYDSRGRGAPALVFVHGWTCDRTFWQQQVEEFAQTHQVVTLDLAGHGESGGGRTTWSMAAFGEDVVAVVSALQLQDVVLIGHSMGGFVVAEAASRLPGRVRGVVGVDTWQDLGQTRTPEQAARVAAPFRANFAQAASAEIRRMFVSTTDSVLARSILDRMLATPAEVGLGALEGILAWDRDDAVHAFARVTAPVIAINADGYSRTNLAGSQSVVPSFQLIPMPGYGHFVMMEDPPRFNGILRQSIAGMPAPARRP